MNTISTTAIKEFSFLGNSFRVINQNNEPWFVLADVAKVLGIVNATDLSNRLRENQRGRFNLGLKNNQPVTIINESGLYRILLRSDKPEAEKFQIWVEDEVLPSIRKHGMYATPITIESMIADPDFAINLLQTLKKETELRQQAEAERERLLHTSKTYTASEIAKECGFVSANALNLFLQFKGIQYFINRTWVLYSKFADKGWTEIKQTELDNGKIVYHRRFTDKGRAFILSLVDEDAKKLKAA